METVLRLGLKYPLMVRPLLAFVKRLRHVFFLTKSNIRDSRLEPLFDNSKFTEPGGRDDCLLETAATIISDVLNEETHRGRPSHSFTLNTLRSPRATLIEESAWVRLKQVFGYRTARALAIESKLPCSREFFPTDEQLVATNYVDVRLKDPGVGRDFVYNVASGSTAWVDVIRERDYGEIMRERWDRVSPIYLPVDSPSPRLEIWKSGHLDVMRSAKQSNKRSGKGSNKTSMK